MRIAPMIALLLLLAACGQTNEPRAATPEAAPDADEEGAADGAKSALESLFGRYERVTYKATYDIFANYDSQQQRSTMTQYFKGEDKVRTDIVAEGQEMRTYLVDETYTTCFNDGEWRCMTLAGSDEESTTEVVDTGVLNTTEEDVDVVALPGRTIAGKAASCFRVTYADGNSDFCLSEEGIPLYSKTSSPEGSSEMIATSVSTSVPDSDFTLPAEPQELPAFDPDAYGTLPADGDYGLPDEYYADY